MLKEYLKTTIFFLVFVCISSAIPALSAEITSISITSSHSGLNGKTTGIIQIRLTYSGYVGNLDIRHVGPGPYVKKHEEYEEFPVPKEYIKNFQKALQADPIIELDLNKFNITEEWIRKKITQSMEIAFEKYTNEEYPTLEERKTIITDRLVNIENTLLKLKRHYKSDWWDDYPKMEVLVKLDDGKSISLHSKSQHLYMIPWTIKKDHLISKTFNINISQTLSEILTDNFMNYHRIKGDAEFLRSSIWTFDIAPNHQTLWAERDFENQLGPIYREFYIVDANVSSFTGDSCCNEPCCKENKLHLSIGHKDWPDNLIAAITLPIRQNKLDWKYYSPKQIYDDAEHLLSIPWLREYISDYPLVNFVFTYKKGLSIDSKSFQNAILKLMEESYFQWNEKYFSYSEDVISLNIRDWQSHWSSWLIFPDETTLVVSASGNPDLKATKVPFSAQLKAWKDLSGARISPDGNIMRPQ